MSFTLNINFNIRFPDGVPGVIGAAPILAEIKSLKETVMSTSEDLAREVAETRQAVTDLTGRYQTKIDTMQTLIDAANAALESGDTPAARQAVSDLDGLQTEMAALAQPAPEPDPNA